MSLTTVIQAFCPAGKDLKINYTDDDGDHEIIIQDGQELTIVDCHEETLITEQIDKV